MSHGRAADRYPANELGDCCVLHLDPAYKHASHYTGFSSYGTGPADRRYPSRNLAGRIAAHFAGHGARLTQVQREAGGTFRLGRLFEGVTREREQIIKQTSGAAYCDICHGRPAPEIPASYFTPELTPADTGVTADESARWIRNRPERSAPVPDAELPPAENPEPAPSLPESFWEAEPEPEYEPEAAA